MSNFGLTVNLVPISILEHEITIFYSKDPIEGYKRIRKVRETEFPEAKLYDDLHWGLSEAAGSYYQTINDNEHKRIFTKVIEFKIFEDLKARGFTIANNFTDGVSIFIPSSERPLNGFSAHKRFDIKVMHDKTNQLIPRGQWSLRVVYDGIVFISNDSVMDVGLNPDLVTKILHENEVKRRKFIADDADINSCRFLLNRQILQSLQLPSTHRKVSNRYLEYFSSITALYKDVLKGVTFGSIAVIQDSGLLPVKESQVEVIHAESNILEFKHGATHFNNFQGLKRYGPYSGPKSKEVKSFFIFHEEDREHGNKLYQYLKNGIKGFPGIEKLVDVPIILDTDKTIRFRDNVDPSVEIIQRINDMRLEEGTAYLAYYISRIKKDDISDQQKAVYYKIKTALINKGVVSQVVYRDNIDNPSFNYFLPNIAIQVLAKLNGVPWRLSRPIENDLVIGIGAYQPTDGEKFLGTSICFKNDGSFSRFSLIESSSIDDLTKFFKDSIVAAAKEFSPKRAIVHFYKKMNKNEEEALRGAMNDISLNIPFIVLYISDDADNSFVVFDENYQAKMPVSGLSIKVSRDLYLLTNNQRYQSNSGMKIDEFPLPLRVHISKTNTGYIEESEIPNLLDQVIQFSRMYWVGIKQKNLPVTILYSQKVARYRENCKDLAFPTSDAAMSTMWFL